jgi:hypothetical protein
VESVRPQQTLLSQCRSQPFLSKQKEALEIKSQGENIENGFFKLPGQCPLPTREEQ